MAYFRFLVRASFGCDRQLWPLDACQKGE